VLCFEKKGPAIDLWIKGDEREGSAQVQGPEGELSIREGSKKLACRSGSSNFLWIKGRHKQELYFGVASPGCSFWTPGIQARQVIGKTKRDALIVGLNDGWRRFPEGGKPVLFVRRSGRGTVSAGVAFKVEAPGTKLRHLESGARGCFFWGRLCPSNARPISNDAPHR